MEDFNVEDQVDENGKPKKKNPIDKKISLAIILIVSLVSGLTVFFVSNALFGKKEPKKEEPVTEEVSITDENVEILYEYVTYGVKDTRNDKFLVNKKVTQDDFTEEEKYYYALQFAEKGDFVDSGKRDNNNQPIYELKASKIDNFMKRFFGEDISYEKEITIEYPFTFAFDHNNVGTISYDSNNDVYQVVFANQDVSVESHIISPYLTELDKAINSSDGTLVLEEKVLYTEVEEENDTYTISIYSDFDKTKIIEKKSNVSKEEIESEDVLMKKYKDMAATVRYTFKTNGSTYYFDNSEIKE